MKKALWVPAVLALALAGDHLGGWFLEKITGESLFRYSRLYRGDAACDVLLVGNSRGLIFYQPYIEEKTGLTTCNLSYNGMPMNLAAALIQDHLDRHDPPKLLLLDISLLDERMDEKLVSSFNPYAAKSERLAALLKKSSPNDYWTGKASHLYRHNGEVFQRAFFYWKKSDEDWLLDRVISPKMQADVAKQKDFAFDFNDEMLAELAAVVSYARQKGVKVELVVNPYYPPFLEKITNLEDLKTRIEAATGLNVRDYSSAVTDAEGFGDYQHLNKRGSKIFLDKLLADSVVVAAKDLSGK